MDQRIIQAAEEFATQKLSSDLPAYAKYHDFEHTQTVVNELVDLAQKEGVDTNTLNILKVAGWFHDLGYLKKVDGHEEISVEIAEDFLSKLEVDQEERKLVSRLIRATVMEYKPNDKLEELMRDADLAHLGLGIAQERSNLLKEEKGILKGAPIKKSVWVKMNIEFLETYGYYTDAAKAKYGAQKQAYLDALKERVKNKKSSKKKKKTAEKTKSKGRGVETMFRVTLKNHTALSQIADNKANIMLSINAIIISVVLSSLLPKLDNNAYLLWPSVLLLTVCIVAVIFATISTIPKVTRNGANAEMVKKRQTNLLFFGNFQGLDLDVYIAGMKDLMDDDDYLYETLMKDLYYLGKVLNKKYHYLRLCYTVFVIGIVLSVIAYMVSLFFMFQAPA
ncbi:MAG: HD superfamily phosphodiesterase [Cryomorphaceae bacterium]|jgi:HD superfamily phosphodiesterase